MILIDWLTNLWLQTGGAGDAQPDNREFEVSWDRQTDQPSVRYTNRNMHTYKHTYIWIGCKIDR